MLNTAVLEAIGVAAAGNVAFGSLLVTILLLNTPGGTRTASAYVVAYIGSYTVIGGIGLWLGAATTDHVVGVWMYAALGAGMLALALRVWRRPTLSPARLLVHLDAVSPARAFGLGLMFPVFNLKNLGIFLAAVAALTTSPMSSARRGVSLGLVVGVFCAAHVIPVALHVLAPRHADRFVARMRNTIESHGRGVMLVVLPSLGSLFLLKGLAGLVRGGE